MKFQILVLCASCMVSSLCGAVNERVVPYNERLDLLEVTKMHALEYAKRYPSGFESIPSPFGEFSPPETAGVPGKSYAGASDMEVLKAISPSIQPTGFLKHDNKYVLLFNTNQVSDGGSIEVEFQGRRYLLYIIDVHEDHFTLRLGDAKLTRDFETGHSGTVAPNY